MRGEDAGGPFLDVMEKHVKSGDVPFGFFASQLPEFLESPKAHFSCPSALGVPGVVMKRREEEFF